jgi:hypothetical protein
MSQPPTTHTLELLHDALTSLTLTRAQVNLGERRLRPQNRPHDDAEVRAGLIAADRSIMQAVVRLRAIEDELRSDNQHVSTRR